MKEKWNGKKTNWGPRAFQKKKLDPTHGPAAGTHGTSPATRGTVFSTAVWIIPDTASWGSRSFHLLRWPSLVFGTKEGCLGEPSLTGVSCLFHKASRHRESGRDWLTGWGQGSSEWGSLQQMLVDFYQRPQSPGWKTRSHSSGAALWPMDTGWIFLPWEWIGSVPLLCLKDSVTETGPDLYFERQAMERWTSASITGMPPRTFDGLASLYSQKSTFSFHSMSNKFTRKAYKVRLCPKKALIKLWARGNIGVWKGSERISFCFGILDLRKHIFKCTA